jgi:hypothetical protein
MSRVAPARDASPIRPIGGSPRASSWPRTPARAYPTAPNSPCRYYYTQLLTKLKRSGRAEVFKASREQPDSELTVDSVCDSVVIAGSPDPVVDEILAFREQVGDFGTLLDAGKDWLDRERGRRSMILMAEKVLPASMRPN